MNRLFSEPEIMQGRRAGPTVLSLAIHGVVIFVMLCVSTQLQEVAPQRQRSMNLVYIPLHLPSPEVHEDGSARSPIVQNRLREAPDPAEEPTIRPKLLAAGFDRLSEQVQPSRAAGVIVTDLLDGNVSDGEAPVTLAMGSAGPTSLFDDSKSGKGQQGEDNQAAENGDERARLLSAPAPVYTDEARRAHISGEVVLQVQLLASGRVRVLTVISGLGFGLDAVAVAAVKQARCSPAKRAGVPFDTIGTIRVQFRLA
jgi:TonB family protein